MAKNKKPEAPAESEATAESEAPAETEATAESEATEAPAESEATEATAESEATEATAESEATEATAESEATEARIESDLENMTAAMAEASKAREVLAYERSLQIASEFCDQLKVQGLSYPDPHRKEMYRRAFAALMERD